MTVVEQGAATLLLLMTVVERGAAGWVSCCCSEGVTSCLLLVELERGCVAGLDPLIGRLPATACLAGVGKP